MHRHKRLNCTLKYTMPHSKQDAYPTKPTKESRSPRRSSPPLCWLSLSLALLSCFIAEREHVESLCIAPVSNTYLHHGNNNCDRCVHDEVNTLIFNVHKRRKTGPQNQKQKQSQLMCSSGFHSCSLATLSDVAHSGTYREYINYCNCGSTTSQYDTRQQKHYHRFGRSLLGTCKRRVVFTYLQMTNKGSTASDSADDANANYEVDDDSESSTDSESVNATIIAINTTTSSVSVKENTTELQNIPDSSQPIIATTNKVDKGLANTAASATSKATSVSSTSPTAGTTSKWEANDFENDYRLLKTAIARQNNILNLRQQQRKHVLDHGFARNRRPLVQDVLRNTIKIGGWMLFLIGGGAGKGFDWDISSWGQTISLKRKCHILATQTIVTVTTIHHWVVGVALPLFLLTWAKYDNKITNDEGKFVKAAKHTHRRQWCKLPRFGPSARTLDDYSNTSGQSSTNAPLFFYTSKKRSNDKDTGDFIICILENWSSAVIASFLWEVGSFGKKRLCASISTKNAIGTAKPNIFTLQLVLLVPTFARLLNRIGAAASLHQYPSLLFELRRSDQPRPMCRPTAYMQSAVNSLLRWLPLGVASDLAVLVGSYLYSTSSSFTEAIPKRVAGPAGLLLNTAGPIFHIMALMRIIHVSKSSAVSLSKATSFQNEFEVDRNDDGTINSGIEEDDDISLDQREKIQWRYQLRWRTPQRIAESLRSWTNYFLTGHTPLLREMDYWKKQPIRYDEFSTEGTHFLLQNSGKLTDENEKVDDLVPHAESITESLSLIFRDRDAAISNATQARFSKHQESYDTKTLDDVLGVAVQQTFGIGVSYEFDHFDPPSEGEELSIHQLRARMAKSAVRRKKELDGSMNEELEVLHRLRDNVVTDDNKDEAEKEMQMVEQGIQERNAKNIDRIRNALLSLIPTNADPPKGTEMYENPIMVAEYVNLTAPVERKDLTATVETAADSLAMIEEYVRRDFGDEAADAYRQEEIAFRRKERDMLSKFRERYGKLEDDGTDESSDAVNN